MQNEEDEIPSSEEKPIFSEARFNNHLKSNLMHLSKNLYLNRTDPLYYEKILRYSDPKSPEAHYHLAQKYEKAGDTVKALLHYQEAAKDSSSAFYANARDSIRRVNNKINPLQTLSRSNPPILVEVPRRMPKSSKILLTSIILFNLVLLLSLLNIDTLRSVVSSVKHASVGMDVIYETVDVPYLIYINSDMPIDKIEKTMYTRASEMGKQKPNLNIQLYGISTTNPTLIGKIVPLSGEHLKAASFVVAQYNASVDTAVKIQFRNTETQKPAESQKPIDPVPPLTMAASNIVRTALQSYIAENKTPPSQINHLLSSFPNNYLSFIPNESQSGSNQVVETFDGNGGWVYKPSAKELSLMFYPNTLDELSAQQIPFSPIEIVISKKDFVLKVITDHYVLASKSVGLGKEDRTPDGEFIIQDRVLKPLGQHPLVYGVAGLSMGRYAIHGTYDASSINSNKSLGCVRVANADLLDIFPLTPKGASVHIASVLPPAEKTNAKQTNAEQAAGKEPLLFLDASKLFPKQKPQIIESSSKIYHWLG
jgi:lipoprotein-anchoring transpeptidase ErfK/SrfK